MNKYSPQIAGWDHISIQKDTGNIVSKSVMLGNQQNFDKLHSRSG
jgi:hypothetical protein